MENIFFVICISSWIPIALLVMLLCSLRRRFGHEEFGQSKVWVSAVTGLGMGSYLFVSQPSSDKTIDFFLISLMLSGQVFIILVTLLMIISLLRARRQ